MNRSILVLPLLMAASATTAGELTPYDNFGSGFVDLTKWKAFSMCGGTTSDCAREVTKGALRLALRSLGGSDSNIGALESFNELDFSNPAPINSIQTWIDVASYSSVACAANPDPADPQLILYGSFFNTGSGVQANDMIAWLQFDRLSDDQQPPNMVRVGGYLYSSQYFSDWADLGYVEVGERARVTLSWEPAAHDFLMKIERTKSSPPETKVRLHYTQSDTLPPAYPFKRFLLATLTPNCTTQGLASAMDVSIDNVRVGP